MEANKGEEAVAPKKDDADQGVANSLTHNHGICSFEERETEDNSTEKVLKDKDEAHNVFKPKQPNSRKKPMRSPRRMKTIKVCKPPRIGKGIRR